ncbi:MAG: hypothetical protein P8176_04070 [Gammaproteobacteria bacterium]
MAPTPETVSRLNLTYEKSNHHKFSSVGTPNQSYSKRAYTTHTWRNPDGKIHTQLMDWNKAFVDEDLNPASSRQSRFKASKTVSKTGEAIKSYLSKIFE